MKERKLKSDEKIIFRIFLGFFAIEIVMKIMTILEGKTEDAQIALGFILSALIALFLTLNDEDDLRLLNGEKERVKPTKEVKIKRTIFLFLEVILWGLMLTNSLSNTGNSHLVISTVLMVIIGFSNYKYTNFIEKNVDDFEGTNEAWLCLFTIPFACITCSILLAINIILAIVSFLC